MFDLWNTFAQWKAIRISISFQKRMNERICFKESGLIKTILTAHPEMKDKIRRVYNRIRVSGFLHPRTHSLMFSQFSLEVRYACSFR
jgi:hypothetical protein